MKLNSVVDYLLGLPGARVSADKTQCTIMCPWCDTEGTSRPHLSVKLEIDEDTPMWYMCFRATCGKRGILDTKLLRKHGCIDPDTLNELGQHNASVSPTIEKRFIERDARDYAMVNLPTGNNKLKLAYVRNRLGVKLEFDHLKNLKIQLSILDLLRLNDIKKLSAGNSTMQNLDLYCVGFISMYNDYMICRDITPDNKTGFRYYTYRISGKTDPNDLKVYCIPTTINIMSPEVATINVAEGPFSILGAFLNTDIGNETENSVWLANCGAMYEQTIIKTCKQYGLLKVNINIWSDSEIKLGMYKKLYSGLKSRLDIRQFTVWYNDKGDDFGHAKKDIDPRSVIIHYRRV